MGLATCGLYGRPRRPSLARSRPAEPASEDGLPAAVLALAIRRFILGARRLGEHGSFLTAAAAASGPGLPGLEPTAPRRATTFRGAIMFVLVVNLVLVVRRVEADNRELAGAPPPASKPPARDMFWLSCKAWASGSEGRPRTPFCASHYYCQETGNVNLDNYQATKKHIPRENRPPGRWFLAAIPVRVTCLRESEVESASSWPGSCPGSHFPFPGNNSGMRAKGGSRPPPRCLMPMPCMTARTCPVPAASMPAVYSASSRLSASTSPHNQYQVNDQDEHYCAAASSGALVHGLGQASQGQKRRPQGQAGLQEGAVFSQVVGRQEIKHQDRQGQDRRRQPVLARCPLAGRLRAKDGRRGQCRVESASSQSHGNAPLEHGCAK